jgi:hypothetical protein
MSKRLYVRTSSETTSFRHVLEQLDELLGEGVEVLAEDLCQVLQLLLDAEYLLVLASRVT